MHESEKWKWSRSVVSDPQRPHGLQLTKLLHPWDFPGKSTGVGCHCLLWYVHIHVYNLHIHVYNLHVQAYLFFFNRKIIALQFCVGFCRTTMRISHSCIHIPFISNLPPLSHPTHPERHREPGWAPCVIWHTSFIALHFTAVCKYCVFYKLKVYGNLSWSKTIATIFQ